MKLFCTYSYKNRRLLNPETPCRYIIARVNESIYFLITLGTLPKSLGLALFTKLQYFELWESGASYKNRRLRNPAYSTLTQAVYTLFVANIKKL